MSKYEPALLVTDLDGTLLAGSQPARRKLFDLASDQEALDLIWATGRRREDVLPLLVDDFLPKPSHIICDVGATVFSYSGMHAIEPLQADIGRQWPGEAVVAAAMQPFSGLEKQATPFERRCSYFCHPDYIKAIHDDVVCAARTVGCDAVYSADRYLDILPRGVTKGATLYALMKVLGRAEERVLVAGDTMNDLSLFLLGFFGVCVGGAEPELLKATEHLPNVLHARAIGCDGILEAIDYFRLFER